MHIWKRASGDDEDGRRKFRQLCPTMLDGSLLTRVFFTVAETIGCYKNSREGDGQIMKSQEKLCGRGSTGAKPLWMCRIFTEKRKFEFG